MAQKYVYLFSEGNATMRNLLGGKGANLAEMTALGMPVPQGFTITTEACTRYYDDGRAIGDDILEQINVALAKIEEINGKKFGDTKNPLLVSVRSGARASMPGMMDTILNLGMNDEVAAGLIAGNPDPKFERFVYDSYRRFIQMFSDVVMELSKKRFEVIIDEVKAAKGITQDIEMDTDDMKELVRRFKAFYQFDMTQKSLKVFEGFIAEASRKGYRLVTINELFGMEANQMDGSLTIDTQELPTMDDYQASYYDLKLGYRTNSVIALQKRLIELGYLRTFKNEAGERVNATADGMYGSSTSVAVSEFQAKVGIPATGNADVETQQRLFAEDAPRK